MNKTDFSKSTVETLKSLNKFYGCKVVVLSVLDQICVTRNHAVSKQNYLKNNYSAFREIFAYLPTMEL